MTFIYSDSKVRDKKLLERARQLNNSLLTVAIGREKLSAAHFAELTSPGPVVKELLDPRIVEGYEIKDAQEALHMINENPELLKTPVLVAQGRMRYIKDFTDLQHLIGKAKAGDASQF